MPEPAEKEEAALDAVLSGGIAKLVAREAVAKISGSLAFRQRLLDVLQDFSFPGAAQVAQDIVAGVQVGTDQAQNHSREGEVDKMCTKKGLGLISGRRSHTDIVAHRLISRQVKRPGTLELASVGGRSPPPAAATTPRKRRC